jgi:hypothetical protein
VTASIAWRRIGIAALLLWAACASEEGQPTAHVPGKTAYSLQMHVHGSYSEGPASMEMHSAEAADVGADVIWWSDHDWRIASFRHVSSYGFEELEESVDHNEPWRAQLPDEVDARKGIREASGSRPRNASAGLTEKRARTGKRSLRIEGQADASGDLQTLIYRLYADRARQMRPLGSSPTLHVSIFPERVSPNARAVVIIHLSDHPRGLEPVPYILRYELDNEMVAPQRRGSTLHIPLKFREGQWNDYSLALTADTSKGFPESHGADNRLGGIAFGIEAREEATAIAYFDELGITQQLHGQDAFERQARLIEDVGTGFPGLRQHQGLEVSYAGPHINLFLERPRMIDHSELLAGALGDRVVSKADLPTITSEITRKIVEDVHGNHGLVSMNHPWGLEVASETKPRKADRNKLLTRMIASRAHDADLLEVGYRRRGRRDIGDHLWLWDQLALAGIHTVGTGVSDYHGFAGQRWRTGANNFLSWIYADSTDKRDLIAGMGAGRVFFGDIAKFDGTIDLTTDAGFRMGQIVVTDRARDRVTVELSAAKRGDRLRLVRSGERVAEVPIPHDGEFRHGVDITLDGLRPTTIRAELCGRPSDCFLYSNPITYVRQRPDREYPSGRVMIDAETRVPLSELGGQE